MRQLAWLHAVPEGSKKSRLTAFTESDGESVFLTFPELDGAGYLVALFQEAGLCMSNGMGAVPLTWQEIESWLRTTELRLTVWEKMSIREMSEAYVAELGKSTNKYCAAPFVQPVPDTLDRAAISDKTANILRGFKKRKPGADQ